MCFRCLKGLPRNTLDTGWKNRFWSFNKQVHLKVNSLGISTQTINSRATIKRHSKLPNTVRA